MPRITRQIAEKLLEQYQSIESKVDRDTEKIISELDSFLDSCKNLGLTHCQLVIGFLCYFSNQLDWQDICRNFNELVSTEDGVDGIYGTWIQIGIHDFLTNKSTDYETKIQVAKDLETLIASAIESTDGLEYQYYSLLGQLKFHHPDRQRNFLEEAIENFRNSLAQAGDDDDLLETELYLGHCYLELKEPSTALEFYRKIDFNEYETQYGASAASDLRHRIETLSIEDK